MRAALRFRSYALGTMALVTGMLLFHKMHFQEPYTMLLAVSSSQVSMLILLNFFAMLAIAIGLTMQSFFLGPLRDREIEYLLEHIFPTTLDIVITVSVYRNVATNTSMPVVIMLLLFKCLNWMVHNRVDYISQMVMSTAVMYVRLASLIILMMTYNALMVYGLRGNESEAFEFFYMVKFEFCQLFFAALIHAVKFAIALIGIIFYCGRWDRRSVLAMHVELVGDFLRFGLDVTLITSRLNSLRFPVYLIRQFAESIFLLRKHLIEFFRYHRITHNLNQRFPLATPAQLEHANRFCVICHDTMMRGRVLNCGHVLHAQCLRELLEHQQTCPVCRISVMDMPAQPLRHQREAAAAPTEPTVPTDMQEDPAQIETQAATAEESIAPAPPRPAQQLPQRPALNPIYIALRDAPQGGWPQLALVPYQRLLAIEARINGLQRAIHTLYHASSHRPRRSPPQAQDRRERASEDTMDRST